MTNDNQIDNGLSDFINSENQSVFETGNDTGGNPTIEQVEKPIIETVGESPEKIYAPGTEINFETVGEKATKQIIMKTEEKETEKPAKKKVEKTEEVTTPKEESSNSMLWLVIIAGLVIAGLFMWQNMKKKDDENTIDIEAKNADA